MQLRMLYEQAKQGILAGSHPVPLDTARQLAGWQMQATWGDCKDGKDVE